MAATFNSNHRTTIICYSPTNVSDETDLVVIYNVASRNNVLIIGGDRNAQIGKNVNIKLS